MCHSANTTNYLQGGEKIAHMKHVSYYNKVTRKTRQKWPGKENLEFPETPMPAPRTILPEPYFPMNDTVFIIT